MNRAAVKKYPKNQKPDTILPDDNKSHRFILRKQGSNPLVALCMNPSVANNEVSDTTVNRVISISKKLNYEGWTVLNIYPERATHPACLSPYNAELAKKNLQHIEEYIVCNKVKEIWGAWGDLKFEPLKTSKEPIIQLLKELGVKVFYFGTLTKANNPRHPIQKQESWINSNYPRSELII